MRVIHERKCKMLFLNGPKIRAQFTFILLPSKRTFDLVVISNGMRKETRDVQVLVTILMTLPREPEIILYYYAVSFIKKLCNT